MDTIKVTVKYPAGHSITTKWARDEGHCPSCGETPIYAEQGPGDFYLGADYACISCGNIWTMQESGTHIVVQLINKQIIDQIREKK